MLHLPFHLFLNRISLHLLLQSTLFICVKFYFKSNIPRLKATNFFIVAFSLKIFYFIIKSFRIGYVSNIKKKEGIFMSHMTLDDRITIQECLNNGISIRTIAKRINKSPSTVMREIKKHKTVKGKRRPDLLDECAFKRTCNIYHLCKDIHCNSACRTCELCKTKCPNYKLDSCDLLLKYHMSVMAAPNTTYVCFPELYILLHMHKIVMKIL